MRLRIDGMLGAADESAVFEKVVALGDLNGKLGQRGQCGKRKSYTYIVGHRRKQAFVLDKPD